MNIIRMTGGLGNQMFQYALYLQFKSMGIDCYFEDFSEYEGHDNARPIQLSAFGIEYPKVLMKDYYRIRDAHPDIFHKVKRKLLGKHRRDYNEAFVGFDEEVLKRDEYYICGFFQSEKYFKSVKEEVLKAFTFTSEVVSEANKIATSLGLPLTDGRMPENSVSLHIRRGDYLAYSNVYGDICTDEYYDKSVEYIKERIGQVELYIFSNDTAWSKEWISRYTQNGIKCYVIEGTDDNNGYIDMYLMSCCHHHIVANSSFSWWGAYLNAREDTITCAPGRWLNNHDVEDIYTESMVRI